MGRNVIHVEAPAERVFEVLSDPRSYSHWVVGSREVRAADPAWPEAGTAFDHAVGTGPLRLKDHTLVEEARPPHLLRLLARARPFPSARVVLRLDEAAGGTRVTMIEDPALPLGSLLIGPAGHALIRLRNAESLRRLRELAEGRAQVPAGDLPPRRRA
jgi:uncharacterized protein YndB with AHSA1/START domain